MVASRSPSPCHASKQAVLSAAPQLTKEDLTTMRHCTAIVLVGFMLFVVEGVVAVLIHSKVVMIVSVAFDSTLLVALTTYITVRWLVDRMCFLNSVDFC